jgi:putative ABC transport system ATP-binding protein
MVEGAAGRWRATIVVVTVREGGSELPIAVEIVEGTKEFGSGQAKVRALDAVSLSVASGSWTAVMGPSGSGKSTLLHCLAGLERLDSGRVRLAGTDITELTEAELTRLRRTELGFVFQNFNLIAALTAEQNVALPLRLGGGRSSGTSAVGALEAVGLGGRAGARPAQLSGGQQQRVAIARAMVTRPAVLFADEPTGALDTAAGRGVLDLMRGMADQGQTIVMVTHDPAAAARADGVTFLRDGAVVDQLVAPSANEVASRLARLER